MLPISQNVLLKLSGNHTTPSPPCETLSVDLASNNSTVPLCCMNRPNLVHVTGLKRTYERWASGHGRNVGSQEGPSGLAGHVTLTNALVVKKEGRMSTQTGYCRDFDVCAYVGEFFSLLSDAYRTGIASKVDSRPRRGIHPCITPWEALEFGGEFGLREGCQGMEWGHDLPANRHSLPGAIMIAVRPPQAATSRWCVNCHVSPLAPLPHVDFSGR